MTKIDVTVHKAEKLNGEITIPSDKSISHRSSMFAALTGGVVEVQNYSQGADCTSTLNIIKELGCDVEVLGAKGVNIITNCYPAAGQAVFHFHVHVIPRYDATDGLKIENNPKSDINFPSVVEKFKGKL